MSHVSERFCRGFMAGGLMMLVAGFCYDAPLEDKIRLAVIVSVALGLIAAIFGERALSWIEELMKHW